MESRRHAGLVGKTATFETGIVKIAGVASGPPAPKGESHERTVKRKVLVRI